jgi:hypothetical protein
MFYQATNLDSVLDGLSDRPAPRVPSASLPLHTELVVDAPGKVRQAGADLPEGKYIARIRAQAESDLYFFARAILDQFWLSPTLHPKVCRWLTRIPPYRKLLMMPRGHGKSCLIGQAMPMHMFIQPKDSNIYYPGQPGTNTRILVVGESEKRATDHLGVIMATLGSNELLRGLWPHIVWDNPHRQARRWNSCEIDLPREREYPDPSIRACGVGSAVVGAHPNCIIQDDLTTEEAANSPLVMQTAIQWHSNAHALLANQATDLVFVTGTRWAVADLPEYIMQNEPAYEVNTEWRGLIEDGRYIYPENFDRPGMAEELSKLHGTMFPLLYFNSVSDSSLTDFDAADLRTFEFDGRTIRFDGTEADLALEQSMSYVPEAAAPADLRGIPLSEGLTMERYRYLRRVRAG